ncbi:MAG: hypothetical protein AAFV88_10655 [Planctomycetota bacterium]
MQQGYEKGLEEGFEQGQGSMLAIETRVYSVADLLNQTDAMGFEELMSEIQENVASQTWEAVGGNATMAPYPQNFSLIVSQSSYGHDKLVDFIETRRRRLVADGSITDRERAANLK